MQTQAFILDAINRDYFKSLFLFIYWVYNIRSPGSLKIYFTIFIIIINIIIIIINI